MTYLDEHQRGSVMTAYVQHELKKARSLNDSEREAAAAKIRSRIGDDFADLFIRVTDPQASPAVLFISLKVSERWRLFHALSYGWQEKELWNCLGLPEFRWELRDIHPEKCVMESPGKWLEDRGLERNVAVTTVLEEAEVLAEENQEELSRMIRDEFEQKSHEVRTDDPLIGRLWPDGRILIHDGNGRLQVWVAKVVLGQLSRDQKIRVFVGIEGPRPHEEEPALEQALVELFPKRCSNCKQLHPGSSSVYQHCGIPLSG